MLFIMQFDCSNTLQCCECIHLKTSSRLTHKFQLKFCAQLEFSFRIFQLKYLKALIFYGAYISRINGKVLFREKYYRLGAGTGGVVHTPPKLSVYVDRSAWITSDSLLRRNQRVELESYLWSYCSALCLGEPIPTFCDQPKKWLPEAYKPRENRWNLRVHALMTQTLLKLLKYIYSTILCTGRTN